MIPMRFLHTSDWHLGKALCNASLLDDQAHMLDQLLLAIRDTRPDALVIAGDVYDRAVPSKEAVSLLDSFLKQVIRDEQTPVLIIAGNHDSPERLGFGASFLGERGLYMAGAWSPEPVVLGNVAFHLVPYGDPAAVRFALGDDAIRTHQDALAAQLTMVRERHPPGLRSVVVAHAFVTGGLVCESELALAVGGAGEVDGRLFEEFDYTALGHLHRPQEVGDMAQVRYAGSLLKYSASEAGHVKSVTLVELPETGPARTEPLILSPRRELRRLKGHFQDLLTGIDPGAREDYLFVELLDQGPVLDAMVRLRMVYPNLLGLQGPQDTGQDPGVLSVDHRSLDPETLFTRFFRETTGSELSEEELDLYREVLARTGLNDGRVE
jgi:DNA repair protein SbcD/Mre11